MTLRVGRLFRILGTMLLVGLLLYVGSAVYYARELATPNNIVQSVSVAPGNAVEISSSYNLTDPGPYPIAGLTLVSHLGLPNSSEFWEAGSAPIDLPGYGTAVIGMSFLLPVGAGEPAEALLTENAALPFDIWVNGTYADLAGVSIYSGQVYDWGAPFSGYRLSVGAPATNPNGTTDVPFGIEFTNNGSFSLDGRISITLLSAGGTFCADAASPVSAGPGSSVDAAGTTYLPSGCSVNGGTYTVEWSGSGLETNLPGGPIP
ncbi:MAG: hypothetical protein ACRECR_01135 [Thermoplasmata archaeon]